MTATKNHGRVGKRKCIPLSNEKQNIFIKFLSKVLADKQRMQK